MQTLIKRNEALLIKYTSMHDEFNIKLHTIIARLLSNKQAFLSMDLDTILDVLYDLGYDQKQAIAQYIRLMSSHANTPKKMG